MKRFCIGDIHGNCKGLIECLQAVNFSYANDKLIVLGDVVDGYPETKKCVNVLLTIKNLVMVSGNHDKWAFEWMKGNWPPDIWTSQGGFATIASYSDSENIPENHIKFFKDMLPYYEEDNCLFVHGGIKINTYAKDNDIYDMMWDRTLVDYAYKKPFKDCKKLTPYKEVFVGHTTTLFYNEEKPIHGYEIWNLDTGAGWGGRLTIMNLDTHEYFQSENAKKLYPSHHGRK